MKKRIWASLLTLVMVLTLLPTTAFASKKVGAVRFEYYFKSGEVQGTKGSSIYWDGSTLYLNNATIVRDKNTADEKSAGIGFNCSATIVLTGVNKIEVKDAEKSILGAIFMESPKDLTIKGSSANGTDTLTLITHDSDDDNAAIYRTQKLTVENVGCLTIETGKSGGKNSGYGVWAKGDNPAVNVTNSCINVTVADTKSNYASPFYGDGNKLKLTLTNSSAYFKEGNGKDNDVIRGSGEVTVGTENKGNPDADEGWSCSANGKVIYHYTDSADAAQTHEASVGVPSNGTATLTTWTAPDRTGYTFKHWKLSGTETTYNKSTKITSPVNLLVKDLDLYAVYEPINYKVQFNANGGTGTMTPNPQEFTYDVAQKLTENTFTREGYTFAGWATSANGSKVYDDEQSVKNLTTTNNATVPLYAVWTPNSYTVTFDKNASDATGTMSTQNFTYGVEQTLTANGFSRAGYAFNGWNTDADGQGTSYADGASAIFSKDTTLYAQWTLDSSATKTLTYYVKYYKDGTEASGKNETGTKIVHVTSTETTLPVDSNHINISNAFGDGFEFDYLTVNNTGETQTRPNTLTDGATVKVYYKTSTPTTPNQPSYDELEELFGGEIKVQCNTVTTHSSTYNLETNGEGKSDSYILGDVTGAGTTENPFKCKITIKSDKYVNIFDDRTKVTHTPASASQEVELTYADNKWDLPAGTTTPAVTFTVTCNHNVVITKSVTGLVEDTYKGKTFQFNILKVTGTDTETGKETVEMVGSSINITGAGSASLRLENGTYYVVETRTESSHPAAYAVETTYQVGSGDASTTPASLTISDETTTPVTVAVTNTYTPKDAIYKVTYEYTGDVPADVAAPQDTTLYRKNDTVTLLTVSPVTGTKDGVNGVWTFQGWTVATNPESGDPAAVTVDDGKFTMPEVNVKATGTWSFEATPLSTLTIQKVLAGDSVSETSFTFNILKEKDGDGMKVVQTVSVPANSSTNVKLPQGNYTVQETDADVTGYDLTTKYEQRLAPVAAVMTLDAASEWTEGNRVELGPDDVVMKVTNTYTKKETPPTGGDDDDDDDRFFFAIKKIDAQDEKRLNGAVFELYQLNDKGEKINGRRSTRSGAQGREKSGIAYFGVDRLPKDDTWYITEVTAPQGYELDDTVYEISNDDFSSTISAAVEDAMVVRNYRTTTPAKLNSTDHYAYVIGYQDGYVRPYGLISRAEVTTIFFRLLTEEWRDGNLRYTNDFTDVSDLYWANTAISTMSGLGIVQGFSDGTFNPTAPITRAQFAAICARFDTNPESGTKSSFTDTRGHWAEKYIQRAAELGWVQGFEDGSFRPDTYITRAQAMTMINRVLNRIPETEDDLLDEMAVWPDCNPGDWYYLAVQEATNSHDFKKKSGNYERWTDMNTNPDWTRYEN